MDKIKHGKGNAVQRALRWLKKRVVREGVLKGVQGHRSFERPTEHRGCKRQIARITAALEARYAVF